MMSPLPIRESGGGVTFAVRVIPRAARNEIAGVQGAALKVRLTAPAVDGAANSALIEFLAQRLGVRKSAVTIVSSSKSRSKTVRVEDVTRAQVEAMLAAP